MAPGKMLKKPNSLCGLVRVFTNLTPMNPETATKSVEFESSVIPDELLIQTVQTFQNPHFTGDIDTWKRKICNRIKRGKYRDYSYGNSCWRLGFWTPPYLLRCDLTAIGAVEILFDLGEGKYADFEKPRW